MSLDDAKQERFALAIAGGARPQQAAEIAEIGRATATRWLKRDDVQHAIAEQRAEIRSRVVDHLVMASVGAASTLSAIAQDATAPKSVRVAASKAILSEARQHVEMSELRARLDAIEAGLSERVVPERRTLIELAAREWGEAS